MESRHAPAMGDQGFRDGPTDASGGSNHEGFPAGLRRWVLDHGFVHALSSSVSSHKWPAKTGTDPEGPATCDAWQYRSMRAVYNRDAEVHGSDMVRFRLAARGRSMVPLGT
jgi:hypothetical protein